AFVSWIDFVGPLGIRRTIAHQRNVGVRAATGGIVAFADAAGAPAADWLAGVTAPLREDRAVAVCGPIFPISASPSPGTGHRADGARVLRAATGNMAFRRRVFDAVRGFDE